MTRRCLLVPFANDNSAFCSASITVEDAAGSSAISVRHIESPSRDSILFGHRTKRYSFESTPLKTEKQTKMSPSTQLLEVARLSECVILAYRIRITVRRLSMAMEKFWMGHVLTPRLSRQLLHVGARLLLVEQKGLVVILMTGMKLRRDG